jgi:hypothetical protein
LRKRVIVHNFHSQVYRTLSKLDYEPDAIVTMDAHLDVHMGISTHLEPMPRKIQLAALRASAHTMMRRVIGELPCFLAAQGLPATSSPEMFLAVPQKSIDTHVYEVMGLVKEAILSGAIPQDTFENPVEEFLEFQSRMWGIKVFASPPRSLLKLVRNLRNSHDCLIDLDVDYLCELQDECYTPLKKTEKGDLGWQEQVLKLIRKTKPQVITVSEAKMSAIRNSNSGFSGLLARLRNVGYSIDFKLVFSSDEDAEDALKTYQDFYEKVQKPLQKRQFAQSGP